MRSQRKPWPVDELAALAAIDPRDVGAVKRFAEAHGRKPTAVSAKLAVLRMRRIARDVDDRYLRRDPFPRHRDGAASLRLR